MVLKSLSVLKIILRLKPSVFLVFPLHMKNTKNSYTYISSLEIEKFTLCQVQKTTAGKISYQSTNCFMSRFILVQFQSISKISPVYGHKESESGLGLNGASIGSKIVLYRANKRTGC